MKCERKLGPKETPCKATATEFVMGQHVCAVHASRGSATCSHSLAPSGRCSFCGMVVTPC